MKKHFFLFLLLSVASLWGCAGTAEETQPAHTVPYLQHSSVQVLDPEEEAAALAALPLPPVPVVLETDAPGILEERSDEAVIDYSNTTDGYVMAQFLAPSETRLKVLVRGPTTTYSYNLPQSQWTVFPLSDGNGTYQIGIYQNVSGTRYATVLSVTCQVELADEFAPFLRPNQYVNYADAAQTLETASKLMTGLEHPLDKVAVVYDYVVSSLSYDYDKAATVKSGYLPDLDLVLETKKGICFDYAALMTAMLRSQGVPCKLVVGYAGATYHAWISVWTDETGWVDGAIFFDGHIWKRMDPTFASSGNRSEEIMDFIENGKYTVKYLY